MAGCALDLHLPFWAAHSGFGQVNIMRKFKIGRCFECLAFFKPDAIKFFRIFSTGNLYAEIWMVTIKIFYIKHSCFWNT